MKKTLIIASIAFLILAGIAFGTRLFSQDNSSQTSGDLYSITRFAVDYTIEKNTAGHSVVHVEEAISANFPYKDTRHGLTRTLLRNRQDGAFVDLSIAGVTDASGQSLHYTTEADNGDGLTLKIGDPQRYVYGDVDYVIRYTLTDPTVYYKKTDRQEWYWNTLGFDWDVPIHNYSATVTLDDSIAPALQETPHCYVGKYGSNDTCHITKQANGSYVTEVPLIKKGENVSLAFGFANGTFIQKEPTLLQRYTTLFWNRTVQTIAFVISSIYIISATWFVATRRYGWGKLHGIIPAQYIPPKDIPLPIAACVMSLSSYQTATILKLAIEHYISIIETRPKSAFKAAEYSIEILRDVSNIPEEERAILKNIFGEKELSVGQTRHLKELQKDTKYSEEAQGTRLAIELLATTKYGFYELERSVEKFFLWSCGIAFLLAVIFCSWPFGLAGILIAIICYNYRRMTPKGLEAKRYLKGYKKYIKASEARRLQMLQGPDTAEKTGLPNFEVGDTAQLVRLYERSLPYAVLFGQEKKWSKRLDELYEVSGEQASWYSGAAGSNVSAGIIVGGISHITGAGGIGFHSGGGGSTGGGFSGGGGGGGGGGSW